MKQLIFLALLAMASNQNSFAYNEKGNGGSGEEVEAIVTHQGINEIVTKIGNFFAFNPILQKTFNEFDIQTLVNISKDVKIETSKEELIDKNGISRTCLNFRNENLIKCNEDKFEKISNPASQFILIFHELLGLLGVEESSPLNEELLSSYKISEKLRPFVKKVSSYDLRITNESKTWSIPRLKVVEGTFTSHTCTIKRLQIFLSKDNSNLNQVMETLKQKGYEIDDSSRKSEYSIYADIDKGIEIEFGNNKQAYFENDSPKEHVWEHSRFVRVNMLFEESREESYNISLVDLDKTRLPIFGEYNQKKTLKWALENIPKCIKH
ncbi:MAG: hypothetical protein AB7I27_02610 [Bacteriovoracaceae bacterium]